MWLHINLNDNFNCILVPVHICVLVGVRFVEFSNCVQPAIPCVELEDWNHLLELQITRFAAILWCIFKCILVTVCSCVVAEVRTIQLHHCDQPTIPYIRVLIATLQVKHRPLARATDNEVCFIFQRAYLLSLIIKEQLKLRRSLYLTGFRVSTC